MAKTILVVDDMEMIREMLKGHLKASDFLVETALDGVEAMEMIQQHRPHCIITDLQMPRMDGWELAQQIKMLFPQIPVIMITGNLNLAAGAPVYQVIGKPFTKAGLCDLIALVKLVTGEPI